MHAVIVIAATIYATSPVPREETPTPAQTFANAKEQCEAKHADACAFLGVHYQNGKGVAKDMKEAVRLFKHACSQGSQVGCTDLAASLVDGNPQPAAIEEAQRLFETACHADIGRACSGFAYTSLTFASKRTKEVTARSYKFAKRGCYLKNGWGCYLVATHYLESKGSEKLARKEYERSCSFDHAPGCILLGQLLLAGKTTKREPERAVELFHRACDLGQPKGCGHLARLFQAGMGTAKSGQNAFKLFKIACDAGDTRSCTDLGLMCVRGVDVPLDYTCAKRRFKKACERDDARGCANLGLIHQKGLKVRSNLRKALGFYIKACDLGDGKACGWTGLLYRDSLASLPQALEKSKEALEKACNHGIAFACAALEDSRAANP